MLAEVKKCAENHDIKGLRYIFVDSLDVDPTFETYREDYAYCKSIAGMFEAHRELSPLAEDSSRWDLRYWEQLKLDLMKNFSEKRFGHMLSVARVVYADKVSRLTSDRRQKSGQANTASTAMPAKVSDEPGSQAVSKTAEDRTGDGKTSPKIEPKGISESELQNRRIEERRKALEEENRQVEARQRAQRERIEAARKAEQEKQAKRNGDMGDGGPKKASGIALAVLAGIVLALLVIVLVRL